MDLSAKIKSVKYTPFLCANLKTFSDKNLGEALLQHAAFILDVNAENKLAISRWVSAKRTRSYPYARVYDTLRFSGKKITIIPVVKDEGKKGDRDFLQWDTVSLMTLLNVHTIIAYYVDAEKSLKDPNKITRQKFDTDYIKQKIQDILSYQSDVFHWNLEQVGEIAYIAKKALENYEKISKKVKVEMHSKTTADRKIKQLQLGSEKFKGLSRQWAKAAQLRETSTNQPKERLSGTKASITIWNDRGGAYYFTADEVRVKNGEIYLTEGKHSRHSLPSAADIKDGLIKMILFANLKSLKDNGKTYIPKAVLKLTVENGFDQKNLTATQKKSLEMLYKEAETNGFTVELS